MSQNFRRIQQAYVEILRKIGRLNVKNWLKDDLWTSPKLKE